jgi:hypothetical protein
MKCWKCGELVRNAVEDRRLREARQRHETMCRGSPQLNAICNVCGAQYEADEEGAKERSAHERGCVRAAEKESAAGLQSGAGQGGSASSSTDAFLEEPKIAWECKCGGYSVREGSCNFTLRIQHLKRSKGDKKQ